MPSLTMLRRLAEQHSYQILREACLEGDLRDPAARILLAQAEVYLGNESAGRRILAELDPAALSLDARVDLAAVHIGLGALDEATRILEAARRENADHALLLARLAWCRLQEGRQADALAMYEQSLSVRPFQAVYVNLLKLYRDAARFEDMARCLQAAWDFWQREQAAWPAEQREAHSQELRTLQLDFWLAREQTERAENWVERQRESLGEDQWCALLSALARRLAARDQHAQAEEWLRTGLRFFPQNPMLYRQLAELAHLRGRQHQTIALLRRAISLASKQEQATGPLWLRLSAVALPGNPALARRAAEQARTELARRAEWTGGDAETLAEWDAEVELAMAAVETQDQDYSAAERRYRNLIGQRPRMVGALQGLGQLLMQQGRIDEAVALFERVKAIDPARGHGALISARRFPGDTETLQRIEALARTPSITGSVRIGLLFQLAAAWETRQDYDKAFALADEANAASRRLLSYDPEAHRQACARIRHAFPKALYAHRPDCGHHSTLPVYVVGMPRSGTTLIEQIIAGHSRIHGAGELGTIPRVIAGLERWERHTGSGRRYPDCIDDLDPAVTRGIAESVLAELKDYAPEADHVVDKLPHNFENIGLIKVLFPRAKIISVRRDPRDIAISNYFTDYAARHGGMGFAYDLDWIGEQLADHNLLMRHWQALFPQDILEIHYEDVVEHPEASARRMLEHIGVGWEPRVLDFHALQRPVRTASVWQVRQPLYATSKARWQHYQPYLQPLIAGANRKIRWKPIEMVTLPEPGWLNVGVDRYRDGDLDAAEYHFTRLLRHLPGHAAARFMLGLVHVCKGHLRDGIELMEQAVERCPWNRHWRSDLARAYRLDGRHQEAAALAELAPPAAAAPRVRSADPAASPNSLSPSGESACSTSASAASAAGC